MPSTIELKLDIDGDIGKVYADKSQISAILINLVSNAFDAMEGRTGELGISLAATEIDNRQTNKAPNLKAGKYARVSVSDTGTGMDEETLHRVLDPFFTTKAIGEGTGMGLAMAYGIVTKHGGALDISTVPGEGTTMSIYIPMIEGGVLPSVKGTPSNGD